MVRLELGLARLKTSGLNEGFAMPSVLADVVVSISELKNDPSAVMVRAGGMPVAVLNRNRVIGYMVPAEFYEQMMERLDDLDLVETSKVRSIEMPIPMILDDL